MSVTIKDRKIAWDKFKKSMREASKKHSKRAEVGIFGNQGADLIEIAVFNEFGTATIPERSFLRSAIAENKSKLINKTAELIVLMVKGNITPQNLLIRLGEYGRSLVVEKINSGEFEPLAPATIKRKKSDVPLIETGRLRRNITSRVGKA